MERKTLNLRIRRNDLRELLNLEDDVNVVQITVDSDGNINLLLESDRFPLLGKRGFSPDFDLNSLVTMPVRIRKEAS